tara:strand:- start:76954 stop:77196 length:243 start_codon:yes stop_codon:yes gene_type:complete
MTELFFVTLIVLVIFMLAMAVGVLVKGKQLQGSCGGLGRVMGEDCMFCDKKSECDTQDNEHDCNAPIKIDAGRAYLYESL